MADEATGFEAEWLDRRIRFLLDRTKAHERKLRRGDQAERRQAEALDPQEDVRSRACAATLLRDTAAISLMRNDVEAGKKYLRRAGRHFLKLGLPHGVLLILLAGRSGHGEEALAPMLRAAAGQRVGEEPEAGSLGPLFLAALHQPEQLLALECSAAMSNAVGLLSEGGGIRDRLHPFRTHPIGMSGVTVASFLRLMDLGRGTGFLHPRAFGNPQLDLMTLFARRGRQLESALDDRHHWSLLLSPSALIDFDLVALFAVWWAHGRSPEGMMPPWKELPPMTMLPVRVARGLASRQEGPLQG